MEGGEPSMLLPFARMGNTTLKHILQRDLHDAPIRGAQNLAERRAVEVVIGTGDCRYDSLEGRGTVIRMVRYVEGFGPKLERLFLLHGERAC